MVAVNVWDWFLFLFVMNVDQLIPMSLMLSSFILTFFGGGICFDDWAFPGYIMALVHYTWRAMDCPRGNMFWMHDNMTILCSRVYLTSGPIRSNSIRSDPIWFYMIHDGNLISLRKLLTSSRGQIEVFVAFWLPPDPVRSSLNTEWGVKIMVLDSAVNHHRPCHTSVSLGRKLQIKCLARSQGHNVKRRTR